MSEQTGQERRPGGPTDAVPPEQMPRDDEPGGESTPLDTEGEGPVGLQDRTRTDQKGSPATNQGKAEPMPATPGHPDPAAPLDPPRLDDMNVGAADPQRPSLGTGLAGGPAGATGAPRDLSGPGVVPMLERPLADATSTTGVDRGPEVPVSVRPGESHRAPGLQGRTSPAEQVETDLEDSAAEMARDTGRAAGPGRSYGVPVVSEEPSPGTAEEHGVVQGARIPRSDGADQG